MNDERLGIMRLTDDGLEVEPIDEDGEILVQKAKELGKKVRIKTEAPEGCSLEPDIPEPLSTCAVIRDLEALRSGELDSLELAERLIGQAIIRARWERGELDPDDLSI